MNRWARKRADLNPYDPDTPSRILLGFPRDPRAYRLFGLRARIGLALRAVRHGYLDGYRALFGRPADLARQIDGWEAERAALSERRQRRAIASSVSAALLRLHEGDPGRQGPPHPAAPVAPGPEA